ncbi:MAG: HD domain-containing protein [Planctomycetota bacterium]
MGKKTFESKAENEACKAQGYKDFGKLNLKYIRDGVENILKLIGRDGIFDEYTLHDMTHIDAMLELLDTLIPVKTAKIMTAADWLLIVLGCYFHDMGMLVTKKEFREREQSEFRKFRDEVLLSGDEGVDYKDALSDVSADELERFYYQEFVRWHHADRIFYWVTGEANERLGASHQAVEAINTLLDGLNGKLRQDLALICRSHHRDDLDQIDSVYVVRRAYAQAKETHANLQYAALLLRTADLLQIQSNRVPSIMYKLIDPTNPKSQDEWAKQMKVRAVLGAKSGNDEKASYDTIEVQAQFDEASGFFGLTAYLQYAESQLKQSAEWARLAAKKAEHEFPWQYIDDSQVEAKGFLPQRYRFEVDREKILKLLTGHTLYNDSSVAIREILQNAIDAVRLQRHLRQGDESVRDVEVEWEPETRRLVVRDRGVGMTRRTIERHLLNIGASYYQERKFKEDHPDFSPISQFGIGVLSYFMISNDVEILTVHPEEEFAHEVRLPSATRRYLIRLLPRHDDAVKEIGEHGTQVSMMVRRSAELEDVEQIVRYWIILPQCSVALRIEGKEEKQIGFSGTNEALKYYLNEYRRRGAAFEMDTKELMLQEGEMSVDVAYAVRYLRWFRVWTFLSRAGLFLGERLSRFEVPAGVCVEGIRVSSQPPGYRLDGLWALANLSGLGCPKTNVARTALEETQELRRSCSLAYGALASHVQEEFDRIVSSGDGITKASIEADFMTSSLARESTFGDELEKRVEGLRIVTIEEEEGRRIVSRRELREIGEVWTVDSPLMDHIDGVCESSEVKLSSREIMGKLTGRVDETIPFPRLVGKGTSSLKGFEVESIRIRQKGMSIAAKWTVGEGRWFKFADEDLRKYASYLETETREILSWAQIAIGTVDCEPATMKCVVVRGVSMHLPKSPVAILWKILHNHPDLWDWLAVVSRRSRVSNRDLPRFRADLEEVGANPDDIIPQMGIKDDEVFDLRNLVREKWYGRF